MKLKSDVLKLARAALEELPAQVQEVALLRATGKRIIVWDYASTDTLYRVYGACRALSLILTGGGGEVTP